MAVVSNAKINIPVDSWNCVWRYLKLLTNKKGINVESKVKVESKVALKF